MESERNPDELKNAPLLRSIPKNDPFVVPDEFFDRFPHHVQARIVGLEQQNNAPSWSGRRSFAWAGGFAAVVIGLALWWVLQAPATDHLIVLQNTSAAIDLLVLDDLDDAQLYSLWERSDPPLADIDLPFNADELIAYMEHEDIPLDLLTQEP